MAVVVRSRARSLSTGRVVFLVIAASAPLTAVVGNVPLAVAYGNGTGLPVAFALACGVLLCFSVGYAAMSRRVVNTGAFYTYVGCGLGRSPAIAAGYLAAVSYTALTAGLSGAVGYFVHLVLDALGIHVAWGWPTLAALVIVAALGFRSVALSATVVGVLVVAELAIVVVMDAGVLVHKGVSALPAAAMSPREALAGSLGIGLMFAFTSFVGFESAALYSEETADPKRSVPRATYLALACIGVFYIGTSWLTVGAVDVAATRAADDPGSLLLDLTASHAGGLARDVMAVLLCTSLLAAMLAFHNVASRYLFALGRDGVLPAALGRYHRRHLSPHVASLVVSVVSAAVVGLFAIARLDPYRTLAASMVGLSTLGVLLLQAMAAVSVVAYFVRHPEMGTARTVVIPTVGATGLAAGFVLAAVHFSTLVGTDNRLVGNLPWLLAVVVVAGFGAGLWLRRTRPQPVPAHTATPRRTESAQVTVALRRGGS